ncbi:MAG TPA: IPT/TIG domain-containing protein [Thermoanaerobaculia bacterium]|jgi:hypothetical protein
MRRFLLQWCLVTFVFALSARAAGPCDDAYPWYYDITRSCEMTDGVCAMSKGVAVTLRSWNSALPRGCATVEWSFGDGSPVVTAGGAETVSHTYTAAGDYVITATIRTASSPSPSNEKTEVAVANGIVKWTAKQVTEGQQVQIPLTRSNTTGSVSVPWTLVDEKGAAPSDVAPVSGTVTFAPGQAVATLTLATANNILYTGRRDYSLVAGEVTNDFRILPETVDLRIDDDDVSVIAFTVDPVRVQEDAGVAIVTLERSGDLTARASTGYHVNTSGSGARIVETFGELVFEPGQASRSFNVPIVDDDVWTGNTTADIYLTAPSANARYKRFNAVLVVEENEVPGIGITAESSVFEEGDGPFLTVHLKLTASAPINALFDLTITDVTAKRNVDYSMYEGSFYFSGTSVSLAVQLRGDEVPEADETFTVTLQQRWGTPVRPVPPITVTIANDDTSFTPDHFRVRRGAIQQATLVVGGSSDTPLVVPLTSSRPELLRVPESVTIPAGATRVSFDMEGLEVGVSIRVTADLPADRGGPQSILGHVYEPQDVTFDPGSVHAYPGQEVPVKVAIDGASGNEFDLRLDVRDATIASAPAAVTILTDGTGTFVVKALKAGTTRLEVKRPGSSNDYAFLEITVAEAPETPAIASISPATGPAAGGTPFVAPGSHLTAACTLSFGGVPATGLTLGADGTLHGITPPHAAGTVDALLTCGAATFVLSNAFTYLDSPPALAAVSPTFGSTAGGTLVRATGTNFQSGCWIFFDDVPATAVEFESTTSMMATVPPRATPGLVATSIRCGAQLGTLPAAYAYSTAADSAASIVSVDPLIGAPGESVTIAGSRFRTTDAVDFDGTRATVLRSRPDQHVVRIPELPAGTSAITLTDAAGRVTTTGPIFLIVEPAPPQVVSVSPAATLPGSEVTLHGRGFRPGYSFAIGGQPAHTLSLRFDQVVVRVGEAVAAGTHPVHVLNAAGRVASIGGAVNVGGGALRLHGVAPACGTTGGGNAVAISGEGFEPGAVVTFNGIPATNVVVVDARQLLATTPANVTGPAVVNVRNANGDQAAATRFTYFSPFDPAGACVPDTRSRSVRH